MDDDPEADVLIRMSAEANITAEQARALCRAATIMRNRAWTVERLTALVRTASGLVRTTR